jgi:hypothetical protein
MHTPTCTAALIALVASETWWRSGGDPNSTEVCNTTGHADHAMHNQAAKLYQAPLASAHHHAASTLPLKLLLQLYVS